MQADTNCRQILGSIDGARLPGCGLKPVVDRADADGDVKQIAQQLFYASYWLRVFRPFEICP
jgi:hypothetical protein